MPRKHEALLFSTLTNHAMKGVILSWSNHRGGRGHLNPKPPRYVVQQMELRGFQADRLASRRLALSAKVAYWIGSSVMVYRRKSAVPPLP